MDTGISKERIQQAKERMGDQAADLIADMLHMEKYNPQRKIGCCPNPAHEDSSPSCSWNPKSHSFYCFGCHATYDIIDAWMATGDTFLQAAEKLFKAADMPHSFTARCVPSDREYVYPKPEWADTKDAVYAYWQKRCISPATIDALGIMQDTHGNTCFPYYDDADVLRCVKVRPSRAVRKGIDKQKCWWLKPSDTMHLLFNQNRINISQPLIICTGEGDCAAAYEAGFPNVTSVPMGDNNTQWIAAQWDWLQQFDSIIIVHDNDESGRKYLKEVTRRLGEYRCRVVEIPETWTSDDGTQIHIKDLNEYLFHAGKQAVADAINNAREREIESVIDFADVSDFDMNSVDGLYTGFGELDHALGKLFCGTTTILTGIAGSGKSSFISTLISRALDQGFPTWIFSGELSAPLLKNWINSTLAGQGNLTRETQDGRTTYRIMPEAVEKINAAYKSQLFMYKDSEPPTISRLLESMEASVKRYGVRFLILDNLSCISLECKSSDKWQKQEEAVQSLIELARKLDVIMVVVIHPHKLDIVRPVGIFDLAGVSASANLAHRILSLYRVQESDREPGKNGRVKPLANYDVNLTVLKDRFGSAGAKTIGLMYDVPSRRFYADPENLAYRYSWDKSGTTDNLQYFDMEKYQRKTQEPF